MTLPINETGKSWLIGRVAFTIATVLFAIFAAGGGLGTDRSIVLEVSSNSIDLFFEGSVDWRLDAATLCPARVRTERRRGTPEETVCPPELFEPAAEIKQFSFAWPSPSRARVEAVSDGGLEVTYIDGPAFRAENQMLRPGSVIVVPEQSWRRSGVLPFSGNAILGREIQSGSAGLLRQGRYEFREKPIAGYDESYIIKSGEFVLGDRVSVLTSAKTSADVVGFIAQSDLDGIFETVIYSGAKDASLNISRQRGSTTLRIAPTWFEAMIRNPLLQATFSAIVLLSALVAFLANLFTIRKELSAKVGDDL